MSLPKPALFPRVRVKVVEGARQLPFAFTTIVTARFGGVVVSATLPAPLNRDAFGIGGVTLSLFCAICILGNLAGQLAFGSSSAELQED